MLEFERSLIELEQGYIYFSCCNPFLSGDENNEKCTFFVPGFCRFSSLEITFFHLFLFQDHFVKFGEVS